MTEQRQFRRRNGPGRTVVVEPGKLDEQPLKEELRGQRGDHQVKAFDPRARQAEHEAHQRTDQTTAEQRHRQAQFRHAQQKAVRGERTDRHEPGRAHRRLAGVAGEQVEAQSGEGQHQERNQNGVQPIVVAGQRHDDKSDQQQAQQAERDATLEQHRRRGFANKGNRHGLRLARWRARRTGRRDGCTGRPRPGHRRTTA
ncbi:hypothetical protein D3C85_753340 [compost metagenome]